MPDLERILADLDDPDRAMDAQESLEREAVASWLPRLLEVLAAHPDWFVREVVAEPIARFDGLKALPQLLHALRKGTADGHDNDGFTELVSDLVWDDPVAAAPLLERMVRSADPEDREDAAWLWGFAEEVLPPDPLIALLEDPSPAVRAAAAGSLGSYEGRDDVYQALLRALSDGHPDVRPSVISALGYFGDERAVGPLRELSSCASERDRPFLDAALRNLTTRPERRTEPGGGPDEGDPTRADPAGGSP